MMMNGRKEGWERELNIIIIHTNNAIRDSWDWEYSGVWMAGCMLYWVEFRREV
jgi:hypothetical protein